MSGEYQQKRSPLPPQMAQFIGESVYDRLVEMGLVKADDKPDVGKIGNAIEAVFEAGGSIHQAEELARKYKCRSLGELLRKIREDQAGNERLLAYCKDYAEKCSGFANDLNVLNQELWHAACDYTNEVNRAVEESLESEGALVRMVAGTRRTGDVMAKTDEARKRFLDRVDEDLAEYGDDGELVGMLAFPEELL